MSHEPQSLPRPKTSLYVALGIGIGLAFALSEHPSWRTVSGGVVFGLTFGLTTAIVQSRRANR
jgi:hypothetical protein